jgi:hypothetical protein
MDYKYYARSAQGHWYGGRGPDGTEGMDALEALDLVADKLEITIGEELEARDDYIAELEVWDVEH